MSTGGDFGKFGRGKAVRSGWIGCYFYGETQWLAMADNTFFFADIAGMCPRVLAQAGGCPIKCGVHRLLRWMFDLKVNRYWARMGYHVLRPP